MKLESEKKGRNWLKSSLFAILVIVLANWIVPGFLPFTTAEIWSFHGKGLVDWLWLGLPVFAWGGGVTLVATLISRDISSKMRDLFDNPPSKAGAFRVGFWLSVWAGVAEELAFRWLLFLSGYVMIAIVNFLIFGWLGFGVSEWLYLNIFGPVANWATLGYLAPWLKGSNWLLGAAILGSTAFFRDTHKYLGWFGYINSWFGGMFLFYVMLTHGLLAAIVIHFLYDLIIFWIGAAFYQPHGRFKVFG